MRQVVRGPRGPLVAPGRAAALALSASLAALMASGPSLAQASPAPEPPTEAEPPASEETGAAEAATPADPAAAEPSEAPAPASSTEGDEAGSPGDAVEVEAIAAERAPAPEARVLIASTTPATVRHPALGEAGVPTPATVSLPVGTHTVEVVGEGGVVVSVYLTLVGGEGTEDARVLVDPKAGAVVSSENGAWAVVSTAGEPTPAPRPETEAQSAEVKCPDKRPCMKAGPLAILPKARIRAAFELQQPDPSVLFIGNNDGFRLDQARFGFDGKFRESFDWRLTIDAAAFFPRDIKNEPVQRLTTGIVDAYVRYAPLPYIKVWAGQSFMPADYEGSTSRAAMVFTDRSVASGGVLPGRGFQVFGLSQGRQIGVVVGTDYATVGPVSLDYRAALSNGNGPATFGNNNKLPAGHFRLGAGWEKYVRVGLGGTYNPRTTGTLPNLYNETDVQGFADLKVDAFGFDFLAQGIVQMTSFDTVFPDVTDPNRSAFGYGLTSWLIINEPFGVPMFGIRPGYRVSFYDPTTAFSDDQLLEHTVGIRYDPTLYDLPIALMLDVTVLMEIDPATGLKLPDNNRLVAMIQFDL